MNKKYLVVVLFGVFAIFLAAVRYIDASWFRAQLYSAAMPVDYFTAYKHITPQLYQISGPVYAFEKEFERSMLIVTQAGIAVFDTFNSNHVTALQKELAATFPNKKVKWVVLSHSHLDHIRGSELFTEAQIIGHSDINQLVADWPFAGKTVSSVDYPIEGDQTLVFDDVEVSALYMPYSHSHTLYGFYVHEHDVVFAPDMMFVNAVPPFGFPDFYYPGYIRALDRLIAKEARHYIPSHMDRGDRADLIAYRNMTVEFQEVVKKEFLKASPEGGSPSHGMKSAIKSAYGQLQPKYGHLHGFDSMFVAKFGRHFGGSYLGY